MSTIDIPFKKIRIISLVSSTLFNISACVYNWMAPLGIAFGCISELADIYENDIEPTNEQALIEVIEEALNKTLRNTTLSSHREIIKELCCSEIEVDNLEDIIKKTETYQRKYCTNADAKVIISMFEYYFKDCLSHYDALSKLYLLTIGYSTLDELKKICNLINNGDKKLDEIKNTVNETNTVFSKIIEKFTTARKEMSYVLVSMSIFLICGVFTEYGFPPLWIYAVIVSYTLSSYFVHHLGKGGYIYESLYTVKLHKQNDSPQMMVVKIITTFLLPIMISIACFLIYVFSTNDRSNPSLISAIIAMASGNLIGIMLRTAKLNN